MKKYAKFETNGNLSVFLGSDEAWAAEHGFIEMDVERGFDGAWYLEGHAPCVPELSYTEQRQSEYPPMQEQLDMIYWDKINGTENWQTMITEIKTKYPKEKSL